MSSAISTNDVTPSRVDHGLQPWQFFVLVALGCATAITFVMRGQGIMAVVLGTVLMAGAALVGMAALRALRPLVSSEDERTPMVGHRTRAALEREKLLTLRTIKELEFDRAMGKLSDADWQEMSTRLRARAARLIHQLDAATGYRDQIERDLAKRLGEGGARPKPRVPTESMEREGSAERRDEDERVCASCSTGNDADARFCKGCGAKL